MSIFRYTSQIFEIHYYDEKNQNEFNQNKNNRELIDLTQFQKRSDFSRIRQFLSQVHFRLFTYRRVVDEAHQSDRKKIRIFMNIRRTRTKNI